MTEKKNEKIAQRKMGDKWNKKKERNAEMETKKIMVEGTIEDRKRKSIKNFVDDVK